MVIEDKCSISGTCASGRSGHSRTFTLAAQTATRIARCLEVPTDHYGGKGVHLVISIFCVAGFEVVSMVDHFLGGKICYFCEREATLFSVRGFFSGTYRVLRLLQRAIRAVFYRLPLGFHLRTVWAKCPACSVRSFYPAFQGLCLIFQPFDLLILLVESRIDRCDLFGDGWFSFARGLDIGGKDETRQERCDFHSKSWQALNFVPIGRVLGSDPELFLRSSRLLPG
jgi:hypothetical protein